MVVRVTTAKIEPADSAQSSIVTNSFVATAGNLIVVLIRCGTNGLVSSVTDTAGNTYVEAISSTGQDPKIFIYYAKNITGHATNIVTVNFSPSAEFSWACAVQYSGLDTVSPVDATDVKSGTGVTDLVSDPFNTTREGVVVLGASQAAFTTYTAGADFTLIDGAIGNSTGDNFGGVQERITSGPLSSYTAHITSGAINAYIVGLVAFKAAIAPTGPMLFRGRTFSFFDDDEVNRFEFWSPIAAEATVHNRAVSLETVGDIVATGQSFSVFSRSVAIDGVGSISTTGISILERSAELSVTATVTVSGVRVIERAASFSAAGAVESSSIAFTVFEASVSLSAVASVESSAVSFSVTERAVAVGSTATITVATMREVLRSVSCAAMATIETSAQSFSVVERSVLVSATGSVEVSGISILERTASLSAAATIAVDGQTEQSRQVSLNATAAIVVSGVVVPPGVTEHERSASLSTTGDIAVTAESFSTLTASVEFASTATITTTGLSIGSRLVMIEATSAITVGHQRVLQRSAQLAAIGMVAVSGAITGAITERAAAFNATANIAVSGLLYRPTSPRRTFVVESGQQVVTVGPDVRVYLVGEPDRVEEVI